MAKKKDDGAPSGIDLSKRPTAVKVNKKLLAILGFVLAAALVVMAVGIGTRGQPQKAAEKVTGKLDAATASGAQVAADVPRGNIALAAQKRSAEQEAAVAAQLAQRAPVLPGVIVPAPGVSGAVPRLPANGAPIVTRPQGGQSVAGLDDAAQARREIEKKRAERYAAALSAGTDAGGAGAKGGAGGGLSALGGAVGGQGAGGVTAASAAQALQQLQQSLQPGARAGGALPLAAGVGNLPVGAGGRSAEDDPNKQVRKESFLAAAAAAPDRGYITGVRKAAISPDLEIKSGWVIPAVMTQGINSDLPGQVSARVKEGVYDTATGRNLLIPQGTTIVGVYDSQVAYGQNGLLVVWQRLVYPDGSTIDLGGFGGTDRAGFNGFRDQVDNHYFKIFGAALLTSAFSAAYQISQNGNQTSVNGQQSSQQVASSAVAQQLSQLGIEIARKNLNIQPTIKIRPGYEFNVRVERDILFPRPYAYGNLD